MAADISPILWFIPLLSFVFVWIIVYALLKNTKVLGENEIVNGSIGFIMAVIFISFSSLQYYVETIIPWFVVLVICVFLMLLLTGFSNGKIENIMNKKFFGWIVVLLLVSIFLIAAIRVFNPIFHSDLILTSGENTSLLQQLRENVNGGVLGTLIFLVITIAVAWFIMRKK